MRPGTPTPRSSTSRSTPSKTTTVAVLRVRVGDDGRGGADLARGSGLVGLKDRVEALGGRITLHSQPGSGTSLSVEVPLLEARTT
jgi:signal transduction histidine kinase